MTGTNDEAPIAQGKELQFTDAVCMEVNEAGVRKEDQEIRG